MTHITLTLKTDFMFDAESLENALHKVGAQITSGVINSSRNDITDNMGRKMGRVLITDHPLTFVQMLKAGHDSNGNKKALYIQYSLSGDVIAVYKHGNKYPSALRVSGVVSLPEVNITTGEFQEWVKDAKKAE